MKTLWLATLGILLLLASPSVLAGRRVVRRTVTRAAPARQTTATYARSRAPAGMMSAMPTQGHTQEIDKALKVTGQSRNLSMDLLFKNDKDKVSFGVPRNNYKDKISANQTNF